MSVKQEALTVFVPLREGQAQPARELLTAIGKRIGEHQDLRFQDSPNTHFARFGVIQGNTDLGTPDRLIFTCSYDGNETAYLAELCSTCGVGLDQIFQFCADYNPGDALDTVKFTKYIRGFSRRPNLFFVSLPGVTARDIRDSGEIGEAMEDLLDHAKAGPLSKLRRAAGILPSRRRRRTWEEDLKKIIDPSLSRLEQIIGIKTGERNPNTVVPVPDQVTIHEDRNIQNSLTIFATVKDSALSKFLLWLILFVGRLYYSVFPPWGQLEGVTSIHFARWVIFDNGRSILFQSTYDGSWDSYIDNFVDVTGPGLNRIWGNCQRFPRLGTKDLDSFKACVRLHQDPALVFYSAYPDLTVKNIIANHTLDAAVQAFFRTPDVDRVLAGSYDIND